MHRINYERIANAIDFYNNRGYRYLEVPWLVSKEAIDVTRPSNSRYFETFLGHLVASGEQSFLEIRDDLCPGRKYQCVTPCFRDDTLDEFHQPYFLKLELIVPLWKTDDAEEIVHEVKKDACNFFGGYASYEGCPVIVKTEIGFDIFMADIEVGSYGWREHKGFRWVYGTGLAEPRFSQVCERIDQQIEASVQRIAAE